MSESSQPPTESPLRTAWHWSVEKSPILNTWRTIHHKLHPQQRATERIIASNLPEPITDRINEIIRRTRLRSIERDEVCRELIDHAADALRESESPKSTDPVTLSAQIAQSLGDPKVAAQLIRRAIKRKRSIYYQARVLLTRTTLAGIAALILVYAGLFVRFHAGSPTIKTDYLALLNATTLATPESDRAISVYQSVMAKWTTIRDELRKLPEIETQDSTGRYDSSKLIDRLPNLDPTHPHYPQVRESLITFRPELDRLHEASQRSIMGYVLTTTPNDLNGEPIELGDSEFSPLNGSLIEVLLPHLGQLRRTARLLAADARLAATQSDAQRVTDDLAAIANTARLLSSDPFLITNLVSIAIQDFAAREINLVLAEHPDLLSSVQLLTLSHTLAAVRDKNLALNLQSESYIFEDILQRGFTDDGHGNGRLTPDGLVALMTIASWDGDNTKPSTISMLAGPISMELFASRAELSRLYQSQIHAAEQTLDRGPESLPDLHAKSDEFENMGPLQQARMLPLTVILPALNKSIRSVFKARTMTDSTLIALAAESYRREHGQYPESLAQLVPQFLPSIPSDPFDPGQPIKYRLTDTGFMVYVAGADGDDDGGTPPGPDLNSRHTGRTEMLYSKNVKDLKFRFPCPTHDHQLRAPDGDWILFPPQD